MNRITKHLEKHALAPGTPVSLQNAAVPGAYVPGAICEAEPMAWARIGSLIGSIVEPASTRICLYLQVDRFCTDGPYIIITDPEDDHVENLSAALRDAYPKSRLIVKRVGNLAESEKAGLREGTYEFVESCASWSRSSRTTLPKVFSDDSTTFSAIPTMADDASCLKNVMLWSVYFGAIRRRYEEIRDAAWENLIQKLDDLRKLSDGWNSYSAPAPTLRAIENARQLLGASKDLAVLPRRVAASVMGGVGITYKEDKQKAYIELYNDGSMHALFSDGKGQMRTLAVLPEPRELGNLVLEVRKFLNG